jgi:hypothetical protein
MKPRPIVSVETTAPGAATFLDDSVPSPWTTDPPEETTDQPEGSRT